MRSHVPGWTDSSKKTILLKYSQQVFAADAATPKYSADHRERHRLLYARNAWSYAHDIIVDMLVVCVLACCSLFHFFHAHVGIHSSNAFQGGSIILAPPKRMPINEKAGDASRNLHIIHTAIVAGPGAHDKKYAKREASNAIYTNKRKNGGGGQASNT